MAANPVASQAGEVTFSDATAARNAAATTANLASDLRADISKASHLLTAIKVAIDEVVDCGDTGEAGREMRLDALDRIIVFCDLAKGATLTAIDLTEEIEALALRSRGGSNARDTHPSTQQGDAVILDAWANRKAAYRALDAIPEDRRSECGTPSPTEQSLWSAIARAEKTIVESNATTPAGIEAQLWTGLHHAIAGPEFHEGQAVCFGDLERLEGMLDRLDEGQRMILSSIRALRSLQKTEA